MNRSGGSKRSGSSDLYEAFSEGLVTASGERVYIPIRKIQRIDYAETRKNIYHGLKTYFSIAKKDTRCKDIS